jgi:hypothetical protein
MLDFNEGFLFVGRDGELYHAVCRKVFYYSVMSDKASPHWSVTKVEWQLMDMAYAGWANTKTLDYLQEG